MPRRDVDFEKLRAALRRMRRGDLLIIAERATELVPKTRLQALVGDRIRLESRGPEAPRTSSLRAEARRFHAAAMRGDYYDTFDVNSQNCTQKSAGTDAFIAEFDRLVTKCIRAVAQQEPPGPVREAFDSLLDLLRNIDRCEKDILFFADEGGSWEVCSDWRTALPAYFRCLGASAAPDEFAREVDRVISDFADRDRPWLLTAARLTRQPVNDG